MNVRPLRESEAWHLFAVQYARSSGVRTARLIPGAPADSRTDMGWYFFVALGNGHVVLIDCGTDALSGHEREALRRAWSVRWGTTSAEALSMLGLSPSDVTDVVVTHHHWDHVGALGAYPRARVHVSARAWSRVPERLRRGPERRHLVRVLRGRTHTLWPGFTAHVVDAHAPGQLMIGLSCASARWVLASDVVYLYRALAEGREPAALRWAVQRVGRAHILPGHDPELFSRYSAGVPGVAAVCP